jgi:hypothetical protein
MPRFLKPCKGLLHSNRLPLNNASERASPDVAEKTAATCGTARKEMTLLERSFRLQSSPALERNNTDGKNPETQTTHAADAKQCDELTMNQSLMSALTLN